VSFPAGGVSIGASRHMNRGKTTREFKSWRWGSAGGAGALSFIVWVQLGPLQRNRVSYPSDPVTPRFSACWPASKEEAQTTEVTRLTGRQRTPPRRDRGLVISNISAMDSKGVDLLETLSCPTLSKVAVIWRCKRPTSRAYLSQDADRASVLGGRGHLTFSLFF